VAAETAAATTTAIPLFAETAGVTTISGVAGGSVGNGVTMTMTTTLSNSK